MLQFPYQVVVGNIGTVYDGSDGTKASRDFREYKQQSKDGYGRAAGEDVTLFYKGEPILEHHGSMRVTVLRV